MSSTTTVIKDQTMTSQQDAMSIEAFYEALEKHDWFFFWADSRHVTRAGEESKAALDEAARVGGESFQLLMSEYSKYCFSGTPWNTPKHPKPPAPGKKAKVAVVILKDADEEDRSLSFWLLCTECGRIHWPVKSAGADQVSLVFCQAFGSLARRVSTLIVEGMCRWSSRIYGNSTERNNKVSNGRKSVVLKLPH